MKTKFLNCNRGGYDRFHVLRMLAGVAFALNLASLPARAQVMEPQLLRPNSFNKWMLGADAQPAPAIVDRLFGGNGVDRDLDNLFSIDSFEAYIRGSMVAVRTVADPATAYSVASDQTMSCSFIAGTAVGSTLYLNTFAKGQLSVAGKGAASITTSVQVQDMTAGGQPVVLQGIPGGNWALNLAAPGANSFEQGWLNQSLNLVAGHRYVVSARLQASTGTIPKNTLGNDKLDLFRPADDQYFNVSFNIEPPIPAGSKTRPPQWRTDAGIRSARVQAAGAIRNGVTLNGNGVNAGLMEGGCPITTHTAMPPARLKLINDGVSFVGADGPQFRDEHATATAGIIAAGNNQGVASGVNLYAAGLNSSAPQPVGTSVGQATLNVFMNGVNQLLGKKVTVINTSFSYSSKLPAGFGQQIDAFVNLQSAANNTVFVASSGNGGADVGDNTSGPPATAAETITVGALDYTLSKVANFSTSFTGGGYPPNLCAPGSLIDTTVVVPMKANKTQLDPANPPSSFDYNAFGYYQMNRGSSFSAPFEGTSFAAPMVTGAVALYQQLASLPDFAAVAGVLQTKTIRGALMTTAWKTKADGLTALYYKDGVTKYVPAAGLGAPGGPVNQEKTLWKDMGAGWLNVLDFLNQLNTRAPVRARGGGGAPGGLAAGAPAYPIGGAPSDSPGPSTLAPMALTGPRTLDVFQIYPQQQQEFTLPVALGLGDSVAVTAAWDVNTTDTNQDLDLAVALYQSASGSTNGNPDLVGDFTFSPDGEVVLPSFLDADPLIVYANGGWPTTEHLYFQVNSASDAGQYYLRIINLSANTDSYALAAWVKSSAYPSDSIVNPEYTITSSAEAGGTVAPLGANEAGPGTNLVLTATPAPGFLVDQWYVDGVSVATNTNTLTLADIETNSDVNVTFLVDNSALDLAVDTETISSTVSIGSTVIFYLPVQNNGPADATNVIVTDLLPDGATFVSAQSSQGTCAYDANSGTLTCQLGTLAASNSAQVTLTVLAPDDEGSITNEVSVTNDVFDAVPGNNAATNSVDVVESLTVDASSDTNGAIYPSGEFSALQGQSQDFIAVPYSGYVVQSWLVDGVPTQEGGTNFVLTDIETNEDVSVEFAAIAAALPNDFPAPVDKGSWVDTNNVAHPWKVGLATQAGPPIYDDQFAGMVTPLAKNGVLMHFAFAECFGGGMLQNLAAIAAARVNLSGTSAAQWNQASWYRQPPYALLVPLPAPNNHDIDWGDTYIDDAGGNNNALNTSIDAWNDDPFRLGTVARPNASGPDESFPFNETAQYRENPAGSGASFTHNPANGGKYAILYSGRPGGNNPANPGVAGFEARPADPNVDAEQIVDLWNLLTDPLGYNYAPADIQVVFGNGALPFGAPNNMKGRVVPATKDDLEKAFCNLSDLTNTDQLFFYANDHGVARNDGMPPGAYLLVPRTPDQSTNFYTNIWLPAIPQPSEGAPQGLERYSSNSLDPFLGWATDPLFVVGATIIQPPVTTNVDAGGTAEFDVGASGTPTVLYQWQFDGTNLAGATNDSLIISNVDLTNYGSYSVTVSNDYGAMTSHSVELLVDGLPPVAGTLEIMTIKNQSTNVSTDEILDYAYEPNGEPLSAVAAGPASAEGGTAVLNGDTVTYTPATNFMGADSFTYTVSDGVGDTNTGTVLVSVWCSTNVTTTFLPPALLPDGTFQINFSGTPNCPYQMQRAAVITGPWTNIGVVTVSPGGVGQFQDTNPPAGNAFYRTSFPP